jgi:catechol 2,3-dioxygenase-like lactoylglutathione lyase family enzyme
MSSSTFFLYSGSNNIPASREFYSELVGLEQVWDEVDHIAYRLVGGVQFSVRYDADVTISREWSFQPGWALGLGVQPVPRSARASWSFALSPASFRSSVARLQHAEVDALRPDPFWVGYWSYVVKDPMGHTVELADPITTGPSTKAA